VAGSDPVQYIDVFLLLSVSGGRTIDPTEYHGLGETDGT
jgi:hypothetical protein